VFWYDSEVNNGGHLQYFENQGTNHLTETINTLKKLKAFSQAICEPTSQPSVVRLSVKVSNRCSGSVRRLTHRSVSEIERTKKPRKLNDLQGKNGLNFAQFWEHLDGQNHGRIELWSFNNPNPVLTRI
jgi:hypothetical protein